MSEPCVTVGVDLAAQDRNTASCRIEWTADGPRFDVPRLDRADADLLAEMRGAHAIGIDAPFGWPEPFHDAIEAHRAQHAWPGRGAADQDEFRRTLRLRATDRVVHAQTGLSPLSVSTDRIAIAAFRCALLLDALPEAPVDRSGLSGRVFEVYPAAALRQWGLTPGGSYKLSGAFDQRMQIVRGVADRLGVGALPEPVAQACEATDHALDALLSALVARAAMLGLTLRPSCEEETRLARIEGWIHIPQSDALDRLAATD